MGRRVALITLYMMTLYTLSADTVTLKNGRIIEGVIEREAGNLVIVETAHGSLQLSRDQVARIERSSDLQQRAQRFEQLLSRSPADAQAWVESLSCHSDALLNQRQSFRQRTQAALGLNRRQVFADAMSKKLALLSKDPVAVEKLLRDLLPQRQQLTPEEQDALTSALVETRIACVRNELSASRMASAREYLLACLTLDPRNRVAHKLLPECVELATDQAFWPFVKPEEVQDAIAKRQRPKEEQQSVLIRPVTRYEYMLAEVSWPRGFFNEHTEGMRQLVQGQITLHEKY